MSECRGYDIVNINIKNGCFYCPMNNWSGTHTPNFSVSWINNANHTAHSQYAELSVWRCDHSPSIKIACASVLFVLCERTLFFVRLGNAHVTKNVNDGRIRSVIRWLGKTKRPIARFQRRNRKTKRNKQRKAPKNRQQIGKRNDQTTISKCEVVGHKGINLCSANVS